MAQSSTMDISTGFALVGLAIAAGTGLIGMLIGYGIYRWPYRIS